MRTLEEIQKEYSAEKEKSLMKMQEIVTQYLPDWVVKSYSANRILIARPFMSKVMLTINFNYDIFCKKFKAEVDIPTWGSIASDDYCQQRDFYVGLGVLLGNSAFFDAIKKEGERFYNIQIKLEAEEYLLEM